MNQTSQPKQQSKRAAVVIGRFQPPHIGHYAVFDAVKKYIRSNADLGLDMVPIVVIVDGKETSKDKARNPLTGRERQSFLESSGLANGMKFLVASSAYDAFIAVRDAGFEPIAIAAGADRADAYLQMLDTYFKTPTGKKIKHHVIELPRETTPNAAALGDILSHMDGELPVKLASASLARLAVSRDEFDKFSIITGLQRKTKLAKLMFEKIRAAIGSTE